VDGGGGPRRPTDATRATLAALVDAVRWLKPSSWRRFGDYAEQVIRGSGLTQYSLDKAAGFAPAPLDRFVSGERSLSLASAAKVAAALGLVLVAQR
jgi:hypothetical protein